jgi:Family of unknown function (DUF6412)
MVTGLARAVMQLAAAHLALGPSGLTALAAAAIVGAALATAVVLIACVARISRAAAALPLLRRAAALREKSWRAAFGRQRDPDAAGRARPRAPSAAPAAAVC